MEAILRLILLRSTTAFIPDHSLSNIASNSILNPLGVFSNNQFPCSNVNKILSDLTNNTIILYDTSTNFTRLEHPFVQQPQTTLLLGCGDNVDNIVGRWREHAMFNARGRVFVLTTNNNVTLWLESLWKRARAADTVIMTADGRFFTWFPYMANECTEVRTVVELSDTQLNINPIKKYSNINKCALYATAMKMVPYVVSHDVDSDNFTEGVEVLALLMMVEKINGVVKFVPRPDGLVLMQTLSKTGEIIGGAKLLRNYQVDIIFSQLKMSYEYQILTDMLYPHNEDDLVWWVPQPKFTSSIHNLYLAFHETTWIKILVVFITFSIVMSTGYNKSLSLTTLNTLAITLNLSITLPKSKLSQYLAIFCFIVYSVNISTSYQASLIHLLSRIPTESLIRSPMEALSKGLFMHLYQSHMTFIQNNDSELWLKMKATKQYEVHNGRLDSEKYAKSGTDMLLQTKSFFLKRMIDDNYYDEYGRPLMYPLPGRQVAIMSMFCMSVGNPLRDELNHALEQVKEGGFLKLWLDRYVREDRMQNIVYVEALKFENISGAFYILLAAEVLAIIIFILEIILEIKT